MSGDTRPERPIRWTSAAEAAAYLGCSKATLYRLWRARSLPRDVRRRLSPGRVLWDLEALDRHLLDQEGS